MFDDTQHQPSRPQELEIPVWVKRGNMLHRRDCLDWDDPDHPYNYIKRLGHQPEDYGIVNPKHAQYEHLDRRQLIDRLANAESELKAMAANGFF